MVVPAVDALCGGLAELLCWAEAPASDQAARNAAANNLLFTTNLGLKDFNGAIVQ